MNKHINITDVSKSIRNIISHNPLVKKIGIFGSLARGNFNENSDIDILIAYDETDDFQPERFLQFCKLCNKVIDDLSNIYGRKIDLVQFEVEPAYTLSNDDIGSEVLWL